MRDLSSAPQELSVDAFAPLSDEFTSRGVRWRSTFSVFVPYQARADGEIWALRLNDFPREPLYTLFVNARARGSFDDWPVAWRKPGLFGAILRCRLVPWAREVARLARCD